MKRVTCIIAVCFFILIGCHNKSVTIDYDGKSQNWDVSYKIQGTQKAHDSYYTFKFTGTENMLGNEIKYQIDGPKEGEDGKFSLDNNNEYTGKMRMTGGIPNPSDRDIRVKIEWNEKTETAMLKRSK